MATRTMFAGDTYPALRGEASDEVGVIDLTSAFSLEVLCDGISGNALTAGVGGGPIQITGAAVAIAPPYLADADQTHFWNWEYQWVAGDTDVTGGYNVYMVVTWSPGSIETFGPDSLSIIPKP